MPNKKFNIAFIFEMLIPYISMLLLAVFVYFTTSKPKTGFYKQLSATDTLIKGKEYKKLVITDDKDTSIIFIENLH